jgi:hypothetical protein
MNNVHLHRAKNATICIFCCQVLASGLQIAKIVIIVITLCRYPQCIKFMTLMSILTYSHQLRSPQLWPHDKEMNNSGSQCNVSSEFAMQHTQGRGSEVRELLMLPRSQTAQRHHVELSHVLLPGHCRKTNILPLSLR